MAVLFSSCSPSVPALLISPARQRKGQRSHWNTAAYLRLPRTAYLNEKSSWFNDGRKQLFPLLYREVLKSSLLESVLPKEPKRPAPSPIQLGTMSL